MKSISRPGETISSSGFESRPGGKGANQAVAIAKAGGSVDFIGIVGSNGRWLIDELRGHGVGVDRMVVIEVRDLAPKPLPRYRAQEGDRMLPPGEH